MMSYDEVKRSNQSSRDGSTKLSLPRSAPSMIPKRVKPKRSVRVESEPSVKQQKGAGDGDFKSLLRNETKSEISNESAMTTNFSADNSSHFLSNLNISCEKITQRTVGTNYSVNDFCEYFYSLHNQEKSYNGKIYHSLGASSESSNCSMKMKKRRLKFFCC